MVLVYGIGFPTLGTIVEFNILIVTLEQIVKYFFQTIFARMHSLKTTIE